MKGKNYWARVRIHSVVVLNKIVNYVTILFYTLLIGLYVLRGFLGGGLREM